MTSEVSMSERNLFLGGGVIFLLCLLVAGWLQAPILMMAPMAIGLGFFLLKDIRSGLYLLVFSLPFSFNLEELTRVNLDFPDEALMLVLTLQFVFFALLNFRQINARAWFRNPLVLLILLSFAWTAVTVCFSENPLLSLKYLLKKSWFLIPFFFLPIILFRDQAVLKRSFQLLFLSLLVVASIVLIRFSAVGFRFEMVHDPLQPFFINHVSYGSMVACLTPATIAALYLSRKLSLQWIISLAGVLLFITAAYLSYSRAAWMSLVFAGITLLLIRLRVMQYAFLVFYLFMSGFVYWMSHENKFLDFKPKFEKTIMHESLEDHILATIQGTDISSAERYYRWIAAIRMSQDRPLTGVGPNNFYDYYKGYTVSSFKTWVSRNPERSTTHNYFLFMLVEQGIPAMLLYALLIFWIFHYGQQVLRRCETRFDKTIVSGALCVVAALFVNNFFSELIESDKIGSLFYLALASVVATDLRLRSTFVSPVV